MTSKERVQAALARSNPDRTPVFMWFHPATARHLSRVLEIAPARICEAMGDDIRQTWVNNNYAMEGIVHAHEGEGHTDFWGIEWRKEGAFNQAVRFPLAGAPPETLADYGFPMDRMEALVGLMAPVVEARGDLFLGVDVSPCVFEMYNRLRGMEAALLDLALHPEESYALLGRCADFAAALSEESLKRYSVDWLWLGDDVAGQQSMMMSPALWRAMIKPHLARVARVGLDYGLPVAHHCCGALRPIIPDLIEIGISVLNPIQYGCPGMEPGSLKAEFGEEMSFMGGVDTIDLLPNATPLQVRHATETLLETMTTGGGGYILAASHTVPPETPDENIFAMYEAAGISKEEILDRAADLRKEAHVTE